MPAIFGAAQFESWARTAKKLVATPALGDVFVKESRHGGGDGSVNREWNISIRGGEHLGEVGLRASP